MANRDTLKTMALRQVADDEELAEALVADAEKLGTVEALLSGEAVLPHPRDARSWHDRITGRAAMTATERTQKAEIDGLKSRLADMEKLIADLPKQIRAAAAVAGRKSDPLTEEGE